MLEFNDLQLFSSEAHYLDYSSGNIAMDLKF